MKTKSTLAILFLFCLSLVPQPARADDAQTSAPNVVWLENYNDALARAKAENKRVLIDFTGSDWCYFCKKMDAEVLSKAAFADYANKNLVLLKVDFPRSRQLPKDVAERNDVLQRVFGVQGFPTFVVLDPEGDEIDRRIGYQEGGPEGFIRFLKVSENAANTK